MNPFEKFVKRHLDKPWDWEYLSINTSITPEFIERHIDKPWSWGNLSKNTFNKIIQEDRDKKRYFNIYKNELIQKTWSSGVRVLDWCMDIDERAMFE